MAEEQSNSFEFRGGACHNEYGERVDPSSDMECWWSLSYAQFLTLPRVAIQSMPTEWQDKLAALLNEMDDRLDWRPEEGRYHTQKNIAEDEYDSRIGGYPEPILVSVTEDESNYRHRRMFLKPPPTPPTAEDQAAIDAILKPEGT